MKNFIIGPRGGIYYIDNNGYKKYVNSRVKNQSKEKTKTPPKQRIKTPPKEQLKNPIKKLSDNNECNTKLLLVKNGKYINLHIFGQRSVNKDLKKETKKVIGINEATGREVFQKTVIKYCKLLAMALKYIYGKKMMNLNTYDRLKFIIDKYIKISHNKINVSSFLFEIKNAYIKSEKIKNNGLQKLLVYMKENYKSYKINYEDLYMVYFKP